MCTTRHQNIGSTRPRLARLILSAALVAAGAVIATAAPAAQAAGLLIADGGFGGVLEIESHSVAVTINNGVAVTEVTQVFRNTEDRQVEALYTFPVPKGASVANFSMWIGGKEMVGEVLEKKRAREVYESYKRTRRDPGLLEQTDYKTFEMRIFPIGPRVRQKVRIRYYQEADCDNDWVTYVYPLSTVSTGRAGSKTTGKFAITLHAKSKVPIVAMESPSHKKDFVIARHADSYYQASLEATGGDLDRDVVLAYRLSRPKTGLDMICSKTGGEDGYFCLTLTAGKELAGRNAPMDYVFVLDISGSMADESKLRISRECVEAFIAELDEQERFEIVTFNVRPAVLFNALTPANDEAKRKAREFLASRQAAGGTVLRPALTTAYKYRDPDRRLNVVILSDGMTEQTERAELLSAIRNRPSNAKVFCVGVGNEVNRPLLKQLAGDSGGLAAFLSRGDSFARQAKAFRRKLTRPAMSNVKIAFAGGGVYDVQPGRLPNLYHGSGVRMYGRYRRAGEVKVRLQAEINGQAFARDVTVTFPKAQSANPEIQRMWAWHKIRGLLDKPTSGGRRSPGVIHEVVRLGEGYSIATEYTSFIVLENDAEYRRWKIKRRNMLLVKRDRDAHRRLLTELDAMRDQSLAALGPQPVPKAVSAPQKPTPSRRTSRPSPHPTKIRNFELPRLRLGDGGGPVGPVGLGIIGLLAGANALACRRRRKRGRKSSDS